MNFDSKEIKEAINASLYTASQQKDFETELELALALSLSLSDDKGWSSASPIKQESAKMPAAVSHAAAPPECMVCILQRKPGMVPAIGIIPGAANGQMICKDCRREWIKQSRGIPGAAAPPDDGLLDELAMIQAAHGDVHYGAAAAAAPPLAAYDDEPNLPAVVAAINAACDERDLAAAFVGGAAHGGAAAHGGDADDDDFHRALANSLVQPSGLFAADDEDLATALSLSMGTVELDLRATIAAIYQGVMLTNGGQIQ